MKTKSLTSNTSKLNATLFLTLTLAAIGGPGASGQVFWINEFHYDNTGSDVNEFIEVVAPAGLADLASVRLTLYNGGDGKPYGASHLLSSFTPGETSSGLQIYSKAIGGLQNGAPDGFALDVGGTVTHFISYEGHFAATTGPAAGLTSQNGGFAENESTAVGSSIGLVGMGLDASEFSWNSSGVSTRGAFNGGQGINAAVVPEPSTYGVMAGFALGAFAFWRKRR